MKLPTFSIAEMMLIVAVFAVDCLLVKSANSAPALLCLVLGGLPIQIALVTGLLVSFGRRRRMEKPIPFLIGFGFVGWIVHFFYVACCILAPESISHIVSFSLSSLLRATGFGEPSMSDISLELLFGALFLTAPQLVSAAVAGSITRWSWKRAQRATTRAH